MNRFVLFLLLSGFAALVNVTSRILFNVFMPYEFAILLAYLTGMATAFTLNRQFVFETSHRSASAQFSRFALVNVVAVAQVWIVSIFLARYALPSIGIIQKDAEIVGHIVGVASPIMTSYYLHKSFSFR